jgi:transmembrane sensor
VTERPTNELEMLYARQASAWVETMRRASPADEMRFVAWLKESPRNVRDFLLMLTLDRALEELDQDRLQNIEALIAEVDQRVIPLPTRPAREAAGAAAISRRRRFVPAAAAACVLALAGGAVALYLRSGFRQYETDTGEQRTFELEDGSVVSLNTHSRVAIRLGAHVREVRLLRGEALFHVRHDSNRPFLVSTDDAVVQDVGTQFDVYRRDDGTVVSVLEGQVNVAPASAPSTRSLGASQEARVSHAGSVSIREVSNVSDTVAWRDRRLVFREQTLERIVGEFNRYRAHPIRLEGDAVSSLTYTGVFDADDAESLLAVLARDPALSVERSGDAIVVRSRPQG